MLDLRVYRATLLPALAAFVVMMFSLTSVPDARRTLLSPDGLDGDRAAATALDLAKEDPVRTPGSAGDTRAATLVRERFAAISGGQVSEQKFRGSFAGHDVTMRNVVLLLPGQSDRRLVLIAARDSAAGPGLVTSASATAAMLEVAAGFSGATHRKTLVFVSTDGGAAAAVGARRFAESFPRGDGVDAMIVLSQPAARRPAPPFVVPWSAGRKSTSAQLVRSAQAAIRDETERPTPQMGTFGQLVQLALPSGLGEQAVLIDRGVDSVAISSAGERPLSPAADRFASFSSDSIGGFARATLSLMLALDASERPLEHGPAAYIPVAGNLLPGWTLRLLAIALILPVGVTLLAAVSRPGGAPRMGPRPVAWVVGRALPFVVALLLVYLFALVRLLPAPEFPYDPGRFHAGLGATIALGVTGVAFVATVWLTRPFRLLRGSSPEGLAISAGLVMAAATLAIWTINPYLALLLVPALHLWQLPLVPRVPVRLAVAVPALLAGLVLPALALYQLADRFDFGLGVFWQMLLQVTGLHLGPATALLACVVAGCGVAMLAAVRASQSSSTHLVQGGQISE
jgi:peptidase M28-like protein